MRPNDLSHDVIRHAQPHVGYGVISGHDALKFAMFALPPITDIGRRSRNVRLVPEAEIEKRRAEAGSIQFFAMISHGIEKRSGLTIEKLNIRRKCAAR